ncbi:GxxExxY protein [Patescibacteria group bacterium]|nr:GxxExxY protein [Patescibacteria group bacterium]
MEEKTKLVHEKLSYEVRGILYKVHSYLGSYRNEKLYCDAIEQGFKVKGLKYEREKVLSKGFVGERSGRNRVDFVVEDKIIIEVKVVPCFSRDIYNQCTRYLVCSGNKLLLLVNFRPKSLHIKRILNPEM